VLQPAPLLGRRDDLRRTGGPGALLQRGALFDHLVVSDEHGIVSFRTPIVDFATKHRLLSMYPLKEFVDAGGLMFYGGSIPEMFRRAAYYVDRILKGAKPSDLPVEQPTKFDMVINLKTAKALGLTIPPSLLARADEVIQ
jgi:putative tryptophan/tyrosine transport system substrate-binding protein